MHTKLLIVAVVLSIRASGFQLCAQEAGTNSPAGVTPFRSLSESSWNSIGAALSRKPLASISITNILSQDEILSMSDSVSIRNGLTNYIDGLCGFEARLERDYVGSGSVVSVSFLWDKFPKVTRFSFFGSNPAAAHSWQTGIVTIIENKLGPGAVRVEIQPKGPTKRNEPVRSETNTTSSATRATR